MYPNDFVIPYSDYTAALGDSCATLVPVVLPCVAFVASPARPRSAVVEIVDWRKSSASCVKSRGECHRTRLSSGVVAVRLGLAGSLKISSTQERSHSDIPNSGNGRGPPMTGMESLRPGVPGIVLIIFPLFIKLSAARSTSATIEVRLLLGDFVPQVMYYFRRLVQPSNKYRLCTGTESAQTRTNVPSNCEPKAALSSRWTVELVALIVVRPQSEWFHVAAFRTRSRGRALLLP